MKTPVCLATCGYETIILEQKCFWCGTSSFKSQLIDLDPIGTVPSLIVFEDQMEDSNGTNVYRSKKNHLNQVVDFTSG